MRKFIFVWFLAVGVISVVGVMWTVPSIRFAWAYMDRTSFAIRRELLPTRWIAAG
jgi:hypothetical protein